LLLAAPAALLAGCTPQAVLNALAAAGAHRIDEGLAYGPDPRQRLDLHRPLDETATTPLVVFFPGGAWNRGERRDYRFVGSALASRGCLVAVVDYRLYPQVRYPEFLRDCAAATAWLLHRFDGPARRVYAFGHSAGAYNAAMLALDRRWLAEQGLAPERLAGWVGLAGPYDFTPIRNPEVRPVFHHPDVPRDSQPIVHAPSSRLRALLGPPSDDALVDPERNTVGLAGALRSAGAQVLLRRYARTNHALLIAAMAPPLRWLAPVRDDVLAFVQPASV
jgi:acetyl esterase/lipase